MADSVQCFQMPGRSLILAIETSNPSARAGCGVALGTPEGAVVHNVRAEGAPDDPLASAVEAIFREAGAAPMRLARVGVSVGPGGFTGVRIAVTTAKMIAEATGCECVPVPTALVVGAAFEAGAFPLAVALASKAVSGGGSAHVTVLASPEDRSAEGGVYEASGLGDLLRVRGVRTLAGDAYLPAALLAAAESAGVRVRPPVFDPLACLRLSAGLPAVDPASLLPIYPREPEAVTKWRAMHGREG